MKKISLFVLGIAVTVASLAQSPAQFGLKGGLNVSTIRSADDDDDNDGIDSKIGVHIGALAHIHLSSQFAVQPEILYSREGAEVEDSRLKLDYINIPVMLQYMFNNGFRIEAGPQLGLLVSSKYKDDDVEVDADDDFKTTNISLGFGVNYLSYSGLGVGARYNLGLSDISEAGNSNIKANTLQISLFYMFDSQHKAKSR